MNNDNIIFSRFFHVDLISLTGISLSRSRQTVLEALVVSAGRLRRPQQ